MLCRLREFSDWLDSCSKACCAKKSEADSPIASDPKDDWFRGQQHSKMDHLEQPEIILQMKQEHSKQESGADKATLSHTGNESAD